MAIKLVSIMAPQSDPLYVAVADYLSRKGRFPVEIETSLPWQDRERMLDRGEAQVGAICGLGYVRRAGFELLAAPVMHGPRYQGSPIYFSELLVKRESAFCGLDDLEGATWAYNERGSHSGYNIVRYHLATLGRGLCWFGDVVETGTHEAALERVLAGRADCAAIDSTVLEQAWRASPALRGATRSLAILGPSPIPPLIVQASLAPDVKAALRGCLLGMHRDSEGAALLAEGQVSRFVPVRDADYEPIRRMDEVARLKCDAPVPPVVPLLPG